MIPKSNVENGIYWTHTLREPENDITRVAHWHREDPSSRRRPKNTCWLKASRIPPMLPLEVINKYFKIGLYYFKFLINYKEKPNHEIIRTSACSFSISFLWFSYVWSAGFMAICITYEQWLLDRCWCYNVRYIEIIILPCIFVYCRPLSYWNVQITIPIHLFGDVSVRCHLSMHPILFEFFGIAH